MALFALVESGVVANTVEAPDDWSFDEVGVVIVRITPGQAAKGWSYDGSVFAAPPAAAKQSGASKDRSQTSPAS